MRDPSTPRAIVLGRFPPPNDGQSVMTRRLAELLSPHIDVQSLNIQPPGKGRDDGGATLTWERARFFCGLAGRLRRVLAESPGATVIWTSVSPSVAGHARDLLVTLPALRSDQRLIAVSHRTRLDRLFQRSLTSWTATRVNRRVDSFVFLTESISQRCARWIEPERRVVIPNTIDIDLVCGDGEVGHKIERGPKQPATLLFIGNMHTSKGYLDVLEASARLVERGLDIRIEFAGAWHNAHDHERFEQRVAAAGLADRVTHHGPVSDRQTLRRLILAADIALLPSYYANEAMPLSVMEAMNGACPVIVTRHGGIPELVGEEGSGRYVPERKPGAIVDAVIQLLDPETWKTAARRARARYREHFSAEAVTKAWLALIHTSGP